MCPQDGVDVADEHAAHARDSDGFEPTLRNRAGERARGTAADEVGWEAGTDERRQGSETDVVCLPVPAGLSRRIWKKSGAMGW